MKTRFRCRRRKRSSERERFGAGARSRGSTNIQAPSSREIPSIKPRSVGAASSVDAMKKSRANFTRTPFAEAVAPTGLGFVAWSILQIGRSYGAALSGPRPGFALAAAGSLARDFLTPRRLKIRDTAECNFALQLLLLWSQSNPAFADCYVTIKACIVHH